MVGAIGGCQERDCVLNHMKRLVRDDMTLKRMLLVHRSALAYSSICKSKLLKACHMLGNYVASTSRNDCSLCVLLPLVKKWSAREILSFAHNSTRGVLLQYDYNQSSTLDKLLC